MPVSGVLTTIYHYRREIILLGVKTWVSGYSTGYSHRGLGPVPRPHMGSQPPVLTSVPGNLMPFLASVGTVCMCTDKGKIQKIK